MPTHPFTLGEPEIRPDQTSEARYKLLRSARLFAARLGVWNSPRRTQQALSNSTRCYQRRFYAEFGGFDRSGQGTYSQGVHHISIEYSRYDADNIVSVSG